MMMPRTAGSASASRAAEPIDAEHALRIGLINRLVDKGEALAEAKKMVAVFEKRGPISLAFAKRAVHTGLQMDLRPGIAFEYSLVTAICATDDKREGVSAFLEEREAKFRGR